MGTSKDAGRACGLEGRSLEEVTRASWRGFTPFDPVTRRANVAFQTEGGEVLRLSVSAADVAHIHACAEQYLARFGGAAEGGAA